jgi:hypothetical protein
MKLATGVVAVKLQYLEVQNANDIDAAFHAASKGHADAVLVSEAMSSLPHG